MNRFVIVDGLPYLYVHGKTYAVRWDENGFTVGAEVELSSVPSVTYPELSIKAKCIGNLDSIGQQDETPDPEVEDQEEDRQDETPDPEVEDQEEDQAAESEYEKMTVEQLKALAKKKGIDLDGARKKADIIAAITSATE